MTVRDDITTWLAARAAVIVEDGDDLVAVADRLAAAHTLDAAAFAAEILDLARVLGESVRSETGFRAALDTGDTATADGADIVVLLSAVAAAVAIGRVGWASRPAARASRLALTTRAQAAYAVAKRFDPDLYAWLSGLVSVAVRLVSQIAADATPIVRVESGVPLPSTVLAYQMHGDAQRARAMVDLAGSGTPMVMPTAFDALAS